MVEGSIAEKWKDRLGKKVKVSLDFMFKVVLGLGLSSVVECLPSKYAPGSVPSTRRKILSDNIIHRKPSFT